MISIEKACINDIKSLINIENICFKEGAWKEKDLTYDLTENPVNTFYVIKEDDLVFGFLNYMITFTSATIIQIAILPQYQKRGFSSMLLDKMFDDIKTLGYGQVETLTLEVRVNNLAAINLYKKYGFNIVTTKKKYYSNGDDAYFMVKGLL